MKNEPFIELSVIIPCWNVAPWLSRCLDEVFAALPPSAEVIAVDDGSDDATPEILARFAAVHPELKVFLQPNRGVSAARNRGLDIAHGEYIFFVDPDDGVEPDFFISMLERMKESRADYCVCAFRVRREDGTFKDWKLRDAYEFSSNDSILEGYVSRIVGYSFNDVRRFYANEPLFARREMASVWRACFRRDVINRASVKFDETISLYEDAMFNVEYLLSATKMTCIDRPLYRVTERNSGAMNTIPRDASRFARNKIRLLLSRKRLNEMYGGRLWRFCEASAVFSVLEVFFLMMRFRLGWGEGCAILREYLDDDMARCALHDFPLSWRKPVLASAVLLFRMIYARRKNENCRR